MKKIIAVINHTKNTRKYVSRVFKRGGTLKVKSTEELLINEVNIRKSLTIVMQREKNCRNKLGVWIDESIWNLDNLKNVRMPSVKIPFTSVIYRFTQTLTHGKVREEADKLSLRKDWNIAEAWNIIIASIMAGEVDVKNTGIFAYFTIKVQDEDVLYRFGVFRNDDKELDVFVRKVDLNDNWDACDGVVLGN